MLTEYQMPVMHGYEATIEVRRHAKWAGLPIIAMTAHVMSGDRDRAIAGGMNDHIVTSIDIELVFATLARWVHDARSGPLAPSPEGPEGGSGRLGRPGVVPG